MFRRIFGLLLVTLNVTATVADEPMFSGLEGRDDERRAKLVKEFGGNDASEKAVAGGLVWIARHQLDDGSWNFDHRAAPACKGKCDHVGSATAARHAATAMALLPFFGAGQTHLHGVYKKEVAAGLKFLIKNQAENGSFHEREGMMYSHGLCAIALCEAYGMTADKTLQKPAQKSIDFIVFAQDPVGGGWRYTPRQRGDTSITGWQIHALQTAKRVGLEVPAKTMKGAAKFLKTTGAEDGAFYGYTSPGKGSSTTAIGLMCRQLTRDVPGEEALKSGVKFITDRGPSISDKRANWYYNFHATALVKLHGGADWVKWNAALRDKVVATQDAAGHASGSWYLTGDHGAGRGGRLYCTALAVLILESYYRHTRRYALEM